MTVDSRIAEATASADFGTPSARKTGRNPKYPYVPVITDLGHHSDGSGQQQIKGLAYATREEAVEAATRHIARERQTLAERLAEPRHRALREQHGLPREWSDL